MLNALPSQLHLMKIIVKITKEMRLKVGTTKRLMLRTDAIYTGSHTGLGLNCLASMLQRR